MGLGELLKLILDNADAVSVVSLAVIFASVFVFGIVTERIHIGPEFRRMAKRAEALDLLVQAQTEELTESRIAHAEARVRLELLEANNVDLQKTIQLLTDNVKSVQAELERIRQTWTPPPSTTRRDRRT